MGEDDLAKLKELLSDAESCGRLSQWEESFLNDLRERVLTYGDRILISGKQQAVIDRIEGKTYAT